MAAMIAGTRRRGKLACGKQADGRPSAAASFLPEDLGMDDLYLRSGIFLAPFHNHDENPTLSIERDLELLEHLDRLNYHEAWIGEHHSGGFELIACPEMFIAAAAQRTRHIRLGTGVVSLPYHNPFMLADRRALAFRLAAGRQIRYRPAVDRWHRPGTDGATYRQLRPLRGDGARQRTYTKPQRLARRRFLPYRRHARAGAQECRVRRAGLR